MQKIISVLMLSLVLVSGCVGSNQTTTPDKNDKQNKDSNWTLVSGMPDDTCTTPTFKGPVDIKGWHTITEAYGRDVEVFHVPKDQLAKLPLQEIAEKAEWFNRSLIITDATPNQENLIKNSSEKKPITISIKEYAAYCEGFPMVNLN